MNIISGWWNSQVGFGFFFAYTDFLFFKNYEHTFK